MLTDELNILALYGLIVALTVIIQIPGAFRQFGLSYVLSAREEDRRLAGITGRLERAHANSVTALVLVAPPILIVSMLDRQSANTLLAAQIFLIARVVYLPAYAFALTGLRSFAWLVGFVATLALYLPAL